MPWEPRFEEGPLGASSGPSFDRRDDATGLARKVVLQLTNSSLRSLRISVISALNFPREYSYAENTEIPRDRREDFPTGLLLVQSRRDSALH